MPKDPHRYDDMLNLPHHQSPTRIHMPLKDRAAQFSPFAALTGYEDVVREKARLTDRRIEQDENERAQLDKKFRMLLDRLEEHPEVTFTYYLADAHKEGGSYPTVTGTVKKIQLTERYVVLYAENGVSDGQVIPIDDIVEITGEMFRL